jgi:plastocyanin
MTRLAGITAIYALIAALVLVTPLSASEEVPAETAAPREAAPGEAVPGEAAPGAAAPEALPPQAEPPPGDPASAEPAPASGQPLAEPAPGPSSSDLASAAEPAQPAEPASSASAEPKPRRSRNRPGDHPRATAAADTNVTIRDFEFAPGSVTIDAGDTVTWTNEGPTPHSATADDGSFDTRVYGEGRSRSHTFENAGTFDYFCTPHPNMRGTVTVRAASTGGGGATGGEGGGASDDGDDAAAGSGSSGSDDGSGATLPATGLDAGGLAVLGLMTAALGVWLRRRAAAAG